MFYTYKLIKLLIAMYYISLELNTIQQYVINIQIMNYVVLKIGLYNIVWITFITKNKWWLGKENKENNEKIMFYIKKNI
jgi:uncharacterized membrane protein